MYSFWVHAYRYTYTHTHIHIPYICIHDVSHASWVNVGKYTIHGAFGICFKRETIHAYVITNVFGTKPSNDL